MNIDQRLTVINRASKTWGRVPSARPWAKKATHPKSEDISLRCQGFNEKNPYDRQTPCDQDYLRKLARDTDAELLQTWFEGFQATSQLQ